MAQWKTQKKANTAATISYEGPSVSKSSNTRTTNTNQHRQSHHSDTNQPPLIERESILLPYVRAAFPALAVETFEEERFTAHVLAAFPNRQVLSISAAGVLKDLSQGSVAEHNCSFPRAFDQIATSSETMLLCFDWQHVARNAIAYRALKDLFPHLKANGSCIVFVAPTWKLPVELEHDLPVLQWALPSRRELRVALGVVAEALEEPVAPDVETACLDAAAGLTLQEAENAFALSVVDLGTLDARRVEAEKMRLVRQSGFLEVWPPVSPERLGGLGAVKAYFENEVLPSRGDDELRVRGILTVGVPGTGKSLLAKVAGAILGWPVLRLDIGALKGSLVGQSEANMRAALRLADAFAPAILMIDEIEKGVGGYQSSASTDSGVTLGMVGTLLTWLQEHNSPLLTIASANDYHKLPPELTRAGRFDETFFVDLPCHSERAEIAAIHLSRFGCVPTELSASSDKSATKSRGAENSIPALAEVIATLTEEWTGAEIEQLVKAAARRSGRQVTQGVLRLCAPDIKPLARVRSEEVAALRQWAHATLRLANTPDINDGGNGGRRVKATMARRGVVEVRGISNN